MEQSKKRTFPKRTGYTREEILSAYKVETDPVLKKRGLKSLRRMANKEGKIKLMGNEQRVFNQNRMSKLGSARQQLNKAYNQLGEVFATHEKASLNFEQFLINYDSNPEILKAFARDKEGLKKRQLLEEQGFQASGGSGKFRPYYVQNGILRGGLTAKGIQVGDNYAIPIQPRGEERVLQSLVAKYTNPNKFPSTRLIKFIRGHWGVGAGKTPYEGVW